MQPAPATVDSWRGVFSAAWDTGSRAGSAGSITADEAQEWADRLVNAERSASTVHDVWVGAARTVFAWAAKRERCRTGNVETVRVSVPRKKTARPHKAVAHTDEIKIILRASLAITDEPRQALRHADGCLGCVPTQVLRVGRDYAGAR